MIDVSHVYLAVIEKTPFYLAPASRHGEGPCSFRSNEGYGAGYKVDSTFRRSSLQRYQKIAQTFYVKGLTGTSVFP